MERVYKFSADLRAKGHVFCTQENLQDAVAQAITDGEFEFEITDVEWYETDERMEW